LATYCCNILWVKKMIPPAQLRNGDIFLFGPDVAYRWANQGQVPASEAHP
jgi:hypothetical protein